MIVSALYGAIECLQRLITAIQLIHTVRTASFLLHNILVLVHILRQQRRLL